MITFTSVLVAGKMLKGFISLKLFTVSLTIKTEIQSNTQSSIQSNIRRKRPRSHSTKMMKKVKFLSDNQKMHLDMRDTTGDFLDPDPSVIEFGPFDRL